MVNKAVDTLKESKEILIKIEKGEIVAQELAKLKEYQRIYPYQYKNKYPNAYKKIKEFLKYHKWCIYCKEYYSSDLKICPKIKCQETQKKAKTEAYEKAKKTLKERYGDEHYNNMEQYKKTCLERHGKIGYNNRGKYKETCQKIYNCDNPFGNPDIIAKGKETRIKKYGDENFNNPKKSRETKLKNHGDPNYNNRPKFKETMNARDPGWVKRTKKLEQTNIKNTGVKNPNQKHIKNYTDYDNPSVIQKFKSVKACADYFGVGYTAAYQRMLKHNPDMVKNRGTMERIIFDSLDCIKYKNVRSIIPPREIDIYLPEHKIGIEYDGLMYHSQGISEWRVFDKPDYSKNYHLQKTLECKSQGIQLLHIFEGENIDLWLSMINSKLGLNERIYARNCYAVELKNSDTKNFLNENHLQGFCNAKIATGLYHKFSDGEKLVAVMTFSKPRFSKGYDYELVRFCSLKGYNIIGGASKLWKFFLKKYNPQSVISYANLRFSNGKLYEKLGFSLKHRSEPNYYYFKPNEGILHSRNKFQKHKLSSILENFDANKSEVENMFANGYRRIFDCGNLVYEWRKL